MPDRNYYMPNSHEVKNAVRQSYYEKSDKAQQVISKNLNEVERFKDMKKGDYILVPFNSYIALAEANEKEI